MEKLPSSEPVLVPQSLPTQFHRGQELSSVPYSPTLSETDKDWMGEEEWLLKGDRVRDSNVYGSSVNNNRGLINDDNILEEKLLRRKKGRRRHGRRLESTTVSSLTNIAKFFSTKNEDESSEEEEPPNTKMVYRRSKKDLLKLILLPLLYILLMGIAILFAFYTIQGLIDSYENRVRSVQQIDVNGRYHAIGIAIFPPFSDYIKCEYRYYDDVSPNPKQPPDFCRNFQIPFACDYVNVTFNSSILPVQRSAMVFKGPTLVSCKESLLLRYQINTTVREFSAMEYILFDQWDTFIAMSNESKMDFLANIEMDRTVYTFPAGFRTWVKLSYSVRQDFHNNQNYTEFSLVDNYASFNGNQTETLPMEVLFEWKDNYYDYIQEIISTTAWSAFGSLCGLFLTLVKAGEFCRHWVRRVRRDREKKILHLQKLEEEQKLLMESYERRKSLRRETKLKKSLEGTNKVSKIVASQ